MKNTFFLLPLLTELSLSPSIHGDRRRLHIRLKQLEISRQKLQLINSLSHLINSLIKVTILNKSRLSFLTHTKGTKQKRKQDKETNTKAAYFKENTNDAQMFSVNPFFRQRTVNQQINDERRKIGFQLVDANKR